MDGRWKRRGKLYKCRGGEIVPSVLRKLSICHSKRTTMWYEILPSAIIICAGLAFPTYVAMGAGWLFLKRHPYWRSLETPDQRKWYLRDADRFGSTYNFVGLEEFFREVDGAGGGGSKECECDEEGNIIK